MTGRHRQPNAPARGDFNLFVPGRLCLFGEHSDWAADYGLHPGFCLVSGTDQGIYGVARAARSFAIETPVPHAKEGVAHKTLRKNVPWNGPALLTVARNTNEFFRYCAGVAYQMMSVPGVTGGVRLAIRSMDLPLGKGVASSAAVCILVAKAFNAVYRLGLFPHELMEHAYLGERLSGSQCGRMDQACIYGQTTVLLTFRKSADPRVEPVRVGGPLQMLFVDLAGRKNTRRILTDLQAAYLRSLRLQEALGPANEQIVRAAYAALDAGDAGQLGRLMTEAQGQFDRLVAPNSPEELASPRLHELLGLKALAPHIHGGKGVGSQGDGMAQLVARGVAGREAAIAAIRQAFPRMRCFPLTLAASGRG